MTKAEEMGAKIATAIAAIPGFTGVRVEQMVEPNDIWELGHANSLIGVCYDGFDTEGPQPIVPRNSTNGKATFRLVAYGFSLASPIAARTKSLGADVLAEGLRALRTVPIGPASQPQVFLQLRGEQLMSHPDRSANGGPVAFVCTYTTTNLNV